jgi:PIF1-like helicase
VQLNVDEITQHVEGRYVSSNEACWRILGFDTHHNSPNVVRLALHLEDRQMFELEEGAPLPSPEQMPPPPKTQLTEFFELNKQRVAAHEQLQEHARQTGEEEPAPLKPLVYQDVPGSYRWVAGKDKHWQEYKVQKGTPTVGRIHPANPNDDELFCLRLLLCHVPNPCRWADLRDWQGTVLETFAAAAMEQGLRQSDNEWHETLKENDEEGMMPGGLRMLLANILMWCSVSNPAALWETHKDRLSEDEQRKLLRMNRIDRPLSDAEQQTCYDNALRHVRSILQRSGRTLSEFRLPEPPTEAAGPTPELILAQLCSPEEQARLRGVVDEGYPTLNAQQKDVFDTVMRNIEERRQGLQGNRTVFVDALAGTGKTFTFNLLLAKVRSEGKVALSVSSSGVAALLLDKGCTAHSRFKLPLDIDSTSSCGIKYQDERAALLRAADLIVWDEAPMMHRHCYEAVDRLLKDIIDGGREHIMGGTAFLLGGDFRQVLPIVHHGDRAATVQATLKRSDKLWPYIRVLHLTQNMRVEMALRQGADPTALQYWAGFLHKCGDGTLPDPDLPDKVTGKVQIPHECCCTTEEVGDLITTIYGDMRGGPAAMQEQMTKSGILTPKNENTDLINAMATQRFPGEPRAYHSADYMTEPSSDDATLYDTEYLNTLDFSGLPPHTLHLKVGMPIMLLRNINAATGMVNGTRLVVQAMRKYSIQAMIVTGTHIGSSVIIPRIPMAPSDPFNPVKFTRRQLPIRPAFAMTITKSQGQTFKKAGVYLPEPCFGHGQLYVALSRLGSPEGLHVMVVNGRDALDRVITDNVVYTELLSD